MGGGSSQRSSSQSGSSQSGETRVLPFEFTGKGGEYFGIWIVNVLLSIVTLGIYSAWAKVRTKNYFYRSTRVDGSSFEYVADPIKILKGRLIVGAFFAASLAFKQYSEAIYLGLTLILVLLVPAIFVLSASFNARNSTYRNVRFAFHGTMAKSYKTFLAAGVAYLFTLGLGFPYSQWLLTQFAVTSHAYGHRRLGWDTTVRQFFFVFLASILFVLPGLVLIGIGVVGLVAAAQGDKSPSVEMMAGLIPGVVLFYAGLLFAAGYTQAKMANIVFGGVNMGAHRLRSDQSAGAVIWILLSNALAVAFSFGLLFPWAKVRLARYRAAHLYLLAQGELLAENDQTAPKRGPLGDAATDLGDLDFDLGF